MMMHRTLIQLDETLHQQLRSLAFEQGVSLSALIRSLLKKSLQGKKRRKKGIKSFKFIGSGRTKKVSAERHDRSLTEDLLK